MKIELHELIAEWLSEHEFDHHWVIMGSKYLTCVSDLSYNQIIIDDDKVRIYTKLIGNYVFREQHFIKELAPADPDFFIKLFDVMREVCGCHWKGMTKWYDSREQVLNAD